MSSIIRPNTFEENRFKSISDFKDCIIRGGEVEFIWDKKEYSITQSVDKIGISEAYKQETEGLFQTTDEVLEYLVNGIRLRDIITQVEVRVRTI